MKFVAKTQFHNAPELGLKLAKDVANFQHELQVPKGHRFEIAPDAKSLSGIKKQDEKQLVSKLVMFDLVVVDDGTPASVDAIKQIDEEVKNDNVVAAATAAARKASEPLTMSTLLKALAELGLTAKK
jgi:hypothetical protein